MGNPFMDIKFSLLNTVISLLIIARCFNRYALYTVFKGTRRRSRR